MMSARTVLVVLPLLALASCGNGDLSRAFGITRDVPDEFTVTTRAPLSMPPDLALRPPRPGAPRPQEMTASQSAEATLTPESALTAPSGGDSAGQAALIAAAGGPAPANTRQKVEQEAALDAPNPKLTDRLMFWKSAPLPGVVIDPEKEAQRLRNNAALGQSVETGDTPIIQRQPASGGLLGGLL